MELMAVVGVEKIEDRLVVKFDVRCSEEVLSIGCGADLCKKIRNG